MNNKLKSSLYFASLVIAIVTYYNVENGDTVQNIELAENTITNATVKAALN